MSLPIPLEKRHVLQADWLAITSGLGVTNLFRYVEAVRVIVYRQVGRISIDLFQQNRRRVPGVHFFCH